jgi:hypothetical protein
MPVLNEIYDKILVAQIRHPVYDTGKGKKGKVIAVL